MAWSFDEVGVNAEWAQLGRRLRELAPERFTAALRFVRVMVDAHETLASYGFSLRRAGESKRFFA